MCGRFTLTRPREVQQRFGFLDWHETRIEPRFNVAPGQEILIIVQAGDGRRSVRLARWGLEPPWRPADSSRRPPAPINARAETLRQRPMFRDAFARTRCLIPATGFYEWRSEPGTERRTPLHIHRDDGALFAFAGLWLPGSGGQPPTAAIVTSTPNELLRPIHNRMPVILRPEHEAVWLDASVDDALRLLRILTPYPSEALGADVVSDLVNSVQNDGPEVLREPVEARAAQLRLL